MIKSRTSSRRSSRTKSKKTNKSFTIFHSFQNEDGEWIQLPVGRAFPKENGRFSLVVAPLASWIGGDPQVNLTFFTKPFEGDNDEEEDDE